MPVDLKLWTPPFWHLPPWTCPRCGEGRLRLNKGELVAHQTEQSKRDASANEHGWSPEWLVKLFSAFIRCDRCKEVVLVAGDITAEPYEAFDEDSAWVDFRDVLTPRHIDAAPQIIKIPRDCSKDVADALRESFALYWTSLEACANKLRQAVELLLTDRGIPRYTLKSGKRVLRSLGARIDAFAKRDKQAADLLDAIRWLGNVGSHPGEISRSDLLAGFDIIEHALEAIYVAHAKCIAREARRIVRRKGRPKPSKRRRS